MNKKLFFVLFFGFANFCFGQNLVINGSFEDCENPQHSPYYKRNNFFASGWYVPYEETPDHFSIANESVEFNTNTSILGKIIVPDGTSCAGLIAFSWNGYTEHLIGTLSSKMEKGRKYRISFLVKYNILNSKIGVPSLGLIFSGSPDIYFNGSSERQVVEFKNDSLNLILGDSVWLKIEQEYIANGNEFFFKLGYFITTNNYHITKTINEYILYNNNDKELIKIIDKNKNWFPVNKYFDINSTFYINQKTYLSYYFIDDVKIIAIE